MKKKKTKTGSQIQFQKLPVKIRRKILKRTKQYHGNEYKNSLNYLLNQRIFHLSSVFEWLETFEGFDFWDDLQQKYKLNRYLKD